ncbi:hypothetical protein Pla22_02930 [Rubripirellula amarantea]|uniref:Uncharacterized protein n=1 Tax=Rubripirellula amarantea TaxID=2527999 RepID=A0A5C5WQ66_9BACT|nr:hypothetical protein [Rubripirellula amarantea]TWT52667.1 hypothetical protein Pla22_02930 [Rubripirellula amarantea]
MKLRSLSMSFIVCRAYTLVLVAWCLCVGVGSIALATGKANADSQSGSGSSTVDVTEWEVEEVDLVELNHFVDEDGREVFRQVIFYDWSKTDRRFHVRGWRLIKDESQLPLRRWKPARYEIRWHENASCRQVNASQLRETWTQQDPERVNRAFLPEDQRIPLFAKQKDSGVR